MTGRGFAAPRAQARVFVRVRMVSVRRRAAALLRAFVVNWPEEASRGAARASPVRFTLVLRMLVLLTERPKR